MIESYFIFLRSGKALATAKVASHPQSLLNRGLDGMREFFCKSDVTMSA
jgi:hypothetical protein